MTFSAKWIYDWTSLWSVTAIQTNPLDLVWSDEQILISGRIPDRNSGHVLHTRIYSGDART